VHHMAPAATFKKKNRLLTALAVIGLLSLTACQSSAPAAAPTSPPAPAAKPTTAAAPAPTAAAAPAATTVPASSAGKPLKVGVLLSTTGPFVFEGTGGIEAIKLYLEQEKNLLGGRPVQMIYEDTEGRPDQALTKAKCTVPEIPGPVSSGQRKRHRLRSEERVA
jgi:ABC-type branched-subunit amino acid transport system substrate-binding protein